MRSSTADVLVRLDAHRKLTLDEALEFVREDECVEVTPVSVRPAQGGPLQAPATEGDQTGAQVTLPRRDDAGVM